MNSVLTSLFGVCSSAIVRANVYSVAVEKV